MLRLMICLATFSLLIGCSGIERPDTILCVVNGPGGYCRGYNLKTDYDDDGKLLPSAEPKFFKAITAYDLNKFVCTTPDGFANVLTVAKVAKEKLKNCK